MLSEVALTYLAYLDEFGHVGPFIGRTDPKHNDSPVFGLAGYLLPSDQVRNFGTWFFQRKCELLDFEIKRAGVHPALWEKKGAGLYTATNVTKYRELRVFTNRLLTHIKGLGGHVFYVGIRKTAAPVDHDPNRMYVKILLEAIKRLNDFCAIDCGGQENFLLALDEHDQRAELITQAARSMYGTTTPRRHLIEPPFHLESHRYQTIQAADWISGLVGRLGAIWANPAEYQENEVFRRYFEHRISAASLRSGIRS